MAAGLLAPGEIVGLPVRKLTEETCKKFGYYITNNEKGTPVQVAPYYDKDGDLVAQKVRGKGKDFAVRGEIKTALPFGAQAFPKTGKMIVVCEGEIDAMSMSQANGNKYPVVSISVGADRPFDEDGKPLPATKTRKYFGQQLEYFNGFEKVVLMFDNDPAGRHSAKAAAEVLGNRAVIAELPLKDANEMLVAGQVKEMIDAMWRAAPYQPDGIVPMAKLRDRVMEAPTMGLSSGWKGWDFITYGHHLAEVILLIAGTGIGKSDVTMQLAEHLITVHHEKLGIFAMEGTAPGTARLLAGKRGRKRFHLPPEEAGWEMHELETAFDEIVASAEPYIYDGFTETQWEQLKVKIKHLRHAHGVRRYIVDNLTSMMDGDEDERKMLDKLAKDMAAFAVTLDIQIILVAHLNRPPSGSKSHEEGGRVTLANIRGSGGIAMSAMVTIGMERNQQAESEDERFTTTLRCLKHRRDGSKVGKTFQLRYDLKTGLLNEVNEASANYSAGASGFGDEEESHNTPTEF